MRKKLSQAETYMKETSRQADEAVSNALAVRKEANGTIRAAADGFRGEPINFFLLPEDVYMVAHVVDTNLGQAVFRSINPRVGTYIFVDRVPVDKLKVGTMIEVKPDRL